MENSAKFRTSPRNSAAHGRKLSKVHGSLRHPVHELTELSATGSFIEGWHCAKLLLAKEQERPAVTDKPARRLRNVCTIYVRAVGL